MPESSKKIELRQFHAAQKLFEPPRDCRRPDFLRGYGKAKRFSPEVRAERVVRLAGASERSGIPMGGYSIRGGQDRLPADALELDPANSAGLGRALRVTTSERQTAACVREFSSIALKWVLYPWTCTEFSLTPGMAPMLELAVFLWVLKSFDKRLNFRDRLEPTVFTHHMPRSSRELADLRAPELGFLHHGINGPRPTAVHLQIQIGGKTLWCNKNTGFPCSKAGCGV